MKRHDRPYGCTFLACGKKFGSKNDWKRHESSQHFQIETWRCDGDRPEGDACSKVCYRKQTFQEHLKKEHYVSDDDEVINEKLETCRIGRNSQDRFWCGFCIKLVELKRKGLDAWTERFDHIDDHFMGRNSLAKQDIRNWIPIDGSERAKNTGGVLDCKTKSDGSDSGSSSSGSTPNADVESHTKVIVRPAKKRLCSIEDVEHPSPKRPRHDQDVLVICVSLVRPMIRDRCANIATVPMQPPEQPRTQ
jgi:hypothetical protein